MGGRRADRRGTETGFGFGFALGFALVATLLLALEPSGAFAQEVEEPEIVSKRYIVVDAETGEIFAQRGAREPAAPASLTKIFTAIEAIEEAPPAYEIVTDEADLVDWDATQVGFGPGETFTAEDLLYGMMLPSGNDAARAIARVLGGEEGDTAETAVGRFMARVNGRIRDMGLTETNLVNPDGWGVPGHYSSAYDIAAFTMYALKYPRFVAAISTERFETSSGGYELVNTNKKLGVDDDLIGGKTGYDDTAGYCLMQIARRGDDTMIAVTLDGVAPDVWYDDNRALLDYAFAVKAAREEGASAGTIGEVVRYLDPDAAVISRLASSSAALGPVVQGGLVQEDAAPEANSALVAADRPDPVAAISADLRPDPAVTDPGGVSSRGLPVAALVAALLALAAGLTVMRSNRRFDGLASS